MKESRPKRGKLADFYIAGFHQWLTVETKLKVSEDHTDLCGKKTGPIPTAIVDKQEIGHWRDGYDQNQLIRCMVTGAKDEKGNLLIAAEEVDNILKWARHILEHHKFGKCGQDETHWDLNFESDMPTWGSEDKWKEVVKSFEKAKEILIQDPDAKIYYYTLFI